MSYFGTRLKYLRKQDNVTQQELASSLGISKSTISMYENGNREPDFETLESIADFFNVPMNTFFPNGKAPSAPDSDLDRYLTMLRDRSEMRMLFDVSENATKEQIEAIVKFIEGLQK